MSEVLSVVVCINRSFSVNKRACANSGSGTLADALERQLAEQGMNIAVRRLECLGQCDRGPNLRIAPGGRFFHHCSEADLPGVIAELQRLQQAE